MTPYAKRLSPLTKRMAEDMLVRNLPASTIDAYTYHVDQFLAFAVALVQPSTIDLIATSDNPPRDRHQRFRFAKRHSDRLSCRQPAWWLY